MKAAKSKTVVGAEHINAAPHRALMKRLRAMTPDQFFESVVSLGIYTKSGKLRAPYKLVGSKASAKSSA